jgi:hypothetical protein
MANAVSSAVASTKKKLTLAEYKKLKKTSGMSVSEVVKAYAKLSPAQRATAKNPKKKPSSIKKQISKSAKTKKTTPAKPAPATPPDPYQTQEDQITAQRDALPTQYNPIRQRDAVVTSQNLVNSGYYDMTPGASETGGLVVQAQQMQHGDILYSIQPGADGKLYRQAYMKVAHSTNQRGYNSGFESGYDNTQMQQSLDAKRMGTMQKAAITQQDSLTKEENQYTKDNNTLQSLIAKGTASQVKTAGATPIAPVPTPTATKPKKTVKTKVKATKPQKMTYGKFVGLHGGKGTPKLKSAYTNRFGVK